MQSGLLAISELNMMLDLGLYFNFNDVATACYWYVSDFMLNLQVMNTENIAEYLILRNEFIHSE